jgi:HK97 family phage prohead protease
MPGEKIELKILDTDKIKFKSLGITKNGEGLEVFRFQGYASVFGVKDSDGDIMVNGAFTETIKTHKSTGRDVPVYVQHMWPQYEKVPVGVIRIDEISEDDYGLKIIAELPTDDSYVSGRIIPQLKIKSLTALSVGFILRKFNFVNIEDDNSDRELLEVDLLEVSIVAFPANDAARITAIKTAMKESYYPPMMKTATPWASLPKSLASRDVRWNSNAAVKRWREYSGSKDKPNARYKNNFLWYDSEDKNNFGAYKLPIGDIIDDRHVAVPRAIFAARAALAGARGGVDIPDNDRRTVEANVNKYYDRMDLDKPFKSLFSPPNSQPWSLTEINGLLKADLSYVLRHCKLSRTAADYISTVVCSTGENNSATNISNEENEAALESGSQDIMIDTSEFYKQLNKRLAELKGGTNARNSNS